MKQKYEKYEEGPSTITYIRGEKISLCIPPNKSETEKRWNTDGWELILLTPPTVGVSCLCCAKIIEYFSAAEKVTEWL